MWRNTGARRKVESLVNSLPRHPRVLLAVCLGYFMAVLDSTVVNVALPDMARGLGTGVAGPVVGGILTHAWSWLSVFLVNLPVGVLGIVLTLRPVPPVPRLADGRLDLGAQALGITALGGLTFGLIQGGVWGWGSPWVVGALVVAGIAGVLFCVGERRARQPMLPPALFRDHTFAAATAVGAILSFGFYGELFLMSLFFQQVQHRSPLATGLALLPQTAVISVMNLVSGQITARRGARLPMALGLGIGGSGLVGLAFLDAHAPLL